VQLQVFTYYGQSRTANIKQLAENDIVLTTYQTLASDSKVCLVMLLFYYQCFDAVGWAAGRASGL